MFRRKRSPSQSARGAEMFEALRSRALDLDPASVGFSPVPGLPRVFGVVMDTTSRKGSATVVAMADGSTSLYVSTGGGVLGGHAHPHVRDANRRLLRTAEEALGRFSERGPTDLPPAGHVRITLLTYSGRRTAEAPEDDLAGGRHVAAPVFAAVHGVIEALRTMEDRRDEAEPLSGGATQLIAVAIEGDASTAARLIQEGAEVDAKDDDGYTALMFAANLGHEDAVATLLKAGADADATDLQMNTPLMFAAQGGHVGVARQLLAAGADINARGSSGLTALGFALQNDHPRTASTLHEAGALE